jgi:hypothetical protein
MAITSSEPRGQHPVPELVEARRVIVIADVALQEPLLIQFLKLGAKGYSCMDCVGKGRHETIEDPYTGRSRVRIEVVTTPAVAMDILEYVHRKEFGPYPVAAFLDTVKVDARDTFF